MEKSRRVLVRSGGVLLSVLMGLAVGLLFGYLAGILSASLTGSWAAALGWTFHLGRAGAIGGAILGLGASLCGADPWLD